MVPFPSSAPVLLAAPLGIVASTLRSLRPGETLTEHFRTGALTLLRKTPSECDALGTLFEDPDASFHVRMSVLDLLSEAGTFDAQAVMRRLLSLASARSLPPTFAAFLQRLGAVQHPDGPTIRFLMTTYMESRCEAAEVMAACAYALGAACGQVAAEGDVEAAARASHPLRCDLEQTAVAAEKSALLAALGNVGLPSDAPLVLRFLYDEDVWVRAAAALACRKMETPDVRARLVEALSDREPAVQRSALHALSLRALEEADVERVAEQVVKGRICAALDGDVLHFLMDKTARASCGSGGFVDGAVRVLLGRVPSHESGASPSGEHRLARTSAPPSMAAQLRPLSVHPLAVVRRR